MTPYFYIIQHLSSGKYYVGSRTSKKANPNELFSNNGYFTSSKIIHYLICKEGAGAFIIRKIKIFKHAIDAFNYETKFLRKVRAQENPNFFNAHYNRLHNCGSEGYKKAMLKQYGAEHTMWVPEIKLKQQQTNMKKYGGISPLSNPNIKAKIKETLIQKYGVSHYSKTDNFKLSLKDTINKKHGVDWPMQSAEIRQKSIETTLRKYGVTNVAKCNDIQQKIKQTVQDKYGVSHISKMKLICPACGHISGLNWLIHHIQQCNLLKERIEAECPSESEYSKFALDHILSASDQQTQNPNVCQCRRCKTRRSTKT